MDYWIGVFTLTCIYLIAILGVSVLYGFTGLFTMGHAGFMSLGAYTSAIITIYFGVPNFVGIVAGVLVAALIGVLIGILTLRMSGDYFVIVTLGIGEAIRIIIQNLTGITGGARGLQGIPSGSQAWMVAVVLVTVVVFLANFKRSKLGRNCIAIREEPLAAAACGIDVFRHKLLAMAISCALCGLSGALLAHYMHYLVPTMFNMAKSNELIMTAILGGRGNADRGRGIDSAARVPPVWFGAGMENGSLWTAGSYYNYFPSYGPCWWQGINTEGHSTVRNANAAAVTSNEWSGPEGGWRA